MDLFLVLDVCVSAASLETTLVPREERTHAKRFACLIRQTGAEKCGSAVASPEADGARGVA